MTKTEFFSALLSKNPSFSKAQLNSVLDSIADVVKEGLLGEGEAIVPGIVRLKAVKKAATKERQGINPFTKETITIAAKPATTKVKASPTKVLKDAIA